MKAIYRTYRPATFEEVTGQEHVKTTIQNQLKNDDVSQAYLFTGPRGVGKTTLARLLAKAVNCTERDGSEPCNACDACESIADGSALDISEIDAASHTDVANVRENIIESVRFAPNSLDYKVYIIDEVHMLSTHAFNALLKTIEEPPEHAIFILATTEIHKVPQTIISRCQRFDFRRIPVKEIVSRLQMISKSEGVDIEESVLFEVARHAEGCPRDAESLLGQILALGKDEVDREAASLVLPATTTVLLVDFLEAVFKDDVKTSIELLNTYVEQGVDMAHFCEDTIGFLRGMLFEALGKRGAFFEAYDEGVKERVGPMIERASADKIRFAIESMLDARRLMKSDKIPQIRLELAVLDICDTGGSMEANTDTDPDTSSPDENSESVAKQENKQPKEKETKKEESVDKQMDKQKQEDQKESPDTTSDDRVAGDNTVAPPPVEPMDEKSHMERLRDKGTEDNAPGDDSVAKAQETAQNSSSVETMEGEAVEVKDEAAGGDVPVVSLDQVKEKWPQIAGMIKEKNSTLPMVFQNGSISDIQGDILEMEFEYALHADTVNKTKNRRLIESIVKKVMGVQVRVQARHSKDDTDETVDTLLNEFGGNVV
jgi:DNA polymerase-3 subunit gamma/tau